MSSLTLPRVLYVLYRYPQLSQTFVRDEIWALREAGVTVDVLSLDDPGLDRPSEGWAGPCEQVTRPSVRRALADLGWWALRRPRACSRLLGHAAREPGRRRYLLMRIPTAARRLHPVSPACVHTHFAWDTSIAALAIADLLGASASITVHAKDIYAQPTRVVRRRIARFDEVVTVCQYNVGYMDGRGMTAVGGTHVRVIPCGVARTEPPDRDDAPLADVVAVGRLVEKKGFEVLLRALAELGDDTPWSRAVIVGEGPERAKLEALSDQLRLSDRVVFVGALEHAQTLEQIGRARVFCLPARPAADGDIDAMPVVIREAMARGVPVIASRLTGIPESVDETVGWLVEPTSPNSLSLALRQALGDEADRERRGRCARERARTSWTFERQVGQLLEVFEGSQ